MLGCHVPRRGTEWKFGIEARGPAIAAAVAVGTPQDRHVVLGQIHTGIIPWVAIATVPGLHGNKRCLGGIARGVFEERARRGGVVLAPDERGERGDASGLAEPLEDRSALTGLIGEIGPGRRVGHDGSGRMLQQLGVEERQGLFERVGLGAWDGPFDCRRVQSMGHQAGDQEVDGVLESTSVVSGVTQHHTIFGSGRGRDRAPFGSGGISVDIHGGVNFILLLQFRADVLAKISRLEELPQLGGALEEQLVTLWDHSQQGINCLGHLVLRSGNGYDITRKLGAGELDLAVPFLLELVNLGHAGEEFTVVQPVDHDTFGNVFCINLFDHVHDLLLDQVQALRIPRWRPTDDIVDLDIIVLLAHSATVHGVRELDEDGVFLHDTLDVLPTDADDALVVLVRHMERDRRGHLLLDKIQAVLGRFVLVSTDIDVEIVLVEAVKDDLNIACWRLATS